MRDNQASFEPDGTTIVYWHEATKVLTPDGLARVASIVLNWNPETDTVIVHRVGVLRGDQAIDVLKTQQFTILRRETNLERAAIDGRLTASLPIASLQVGDIVDLAASIRHRDPALGGHIESRFIFQPTTADTQFAAHWTKPRPVQWRVMPGLPTPLAETSGRETRLSLAVADLKEPLLPKGAPPRFRQADVLQLSDWRSWAEISTLMAPLYAKASALPPGSPVAAEAARIAAATPDPVARAEAALALVQEQVRYLFVGLNDGGYVPEPAETTWQRRYGDCKGKTVLLLALLHALGIEAQPVLVNATGFGDAIPRYLPAAGLFDHVLVRATIDGRSYWLDGTRMGDRHLANIDTPAFRWGLPIQRAGATLVPMMPDSPSKPLARTIVTLDASAGADRPAPFHAEFIARGDRAISTHRALDAMLPEARGRALRKFWHKSYDYVAPTRLDARFDPATGTETLTLDGVATLDWQDDALELTNMQVGQSVDFARAPGPDDDAPFVLAYPFFSEVHETILLPNKEKGFTLDPLAFDQVIAGAATHREGSISEGIVTLDVTRRGLAPEFPAKDASAAEQQLRRLAHQHVYLRRTSAAAETSPTAR